MVMSNYELYHAYMVYCYSLRLKGFSLYSRGEYPCAIKSNTENSIVAEVFNIIDPVVEREIDRMELEDGYFYDEVIIGAERIGIYLFPDNENFIEVAAGDWVTFFRDLL